MAAWGIQSELDSTRDELRAEESRLEQQLRAPYDGRMADPAELEASIATRRARVAWLRDYVRAMEAK